MKTGTGHRIYSALASSAATVGRRSGITRVLRPLEKQDGMALLLTVLLITLATVLTMHFSRRMQAEVYGAANLGDSVRLGCMTRSAFNAARAVLAADSRDNNFDTLHEPWARLGLAGNYAAGFFENGRLEVRVTDLAGRIQLNSLLEEKQEGGRVVDQEQRAMLERFLRLEDFGLDDTEAASLVEALIDWLDPDDEVTGFGGAEESYYRSLEQPYACRNGPLEFTEELLLVKGMTRELYYGSPDRPGIERYLTAFGEDGRININTAEPAVLMALSEQIDNEMVDNILDFRAGEENDLSDPNWFRAVLPGDVQIPEGLISVQGGDFLVEVEALEERMKKHGSGIVRRMPDKSVPVLSWKID